MAPGLLHIKKQCTALAKFIIERRALQLIEYRRDRLREITSCVEGVGTFGTSPDRCRRSTTLESCLRHPGDQSRYELSGNEALREHAELIESSRNDQSSTVGECLKRFDNDLLWTLINTCPSSDDGSFRAALLLLSESSGANRDNGNS